MDEPKKPVSVTSYKQGISARNVQRKEERQGQGVFPNLAQAAVEYNPSQGARTMAQIAEEQRSIVDAPKEAGISAATIEGLKALKATAEQQETRKPAPAQAAPAADTSAESEGADSELLEVLRVMQQNAKEHEQQREEIEARLTPIDLSAGLLTGCFLQEVPIVPGQLVVQYQSITALDHYEIGAKVYLQVRERPELEPMSGLLTGFYQTVASLRRLNATVFPGHVRQEGHRAVFDTALFEQKVQDFMRYPVALIGCLGMHGQWFDARVRKLFTVSSLKNG